MTTSKHAELFIRLRQQHLPAILNLINKTVEETLTNESELARMINYHLSTGGKRLRAIIPLQLASLQNEDPRDLIPFGAACELLHNATLIHDDLQDGDGVRRGYETVWHKYGSESAINVGDAMLYIAPLLLRYDISITSQTQIELTELLLRYTIRVIDGQEREFQLRKLHHPTWSNYFEMVEGKTSGLFCLPIVGAAKRLGLSARDEEELEIAGRHLGILFQIQDDLLDIYGDKERNESCSDLREGKISALIVHTLESLHLKDRIDDANWLRRLLEINRDDVNTDDLGRAVHLFEDCNTKDAMLAIIKEHEDLAVQTVSDPTLQEFVRELTQVFCEPLEELRERPVID